MLPSRVSRDVVLDNYATFHFVTSGQNLTDVQHLWLPASCMKVEAIKAKAGNGEYHIVNNTSMKTKLDVPENFCVITRFVPSSVSN